MNFHKKLLLGKFIVIAEMNTPKGVNISIFIENAKKIKDKVDAIIIPDSNNGIVSISAIAGASILENQGIETIIHIYGRDKNRISLQSDMLGAYVLGINNFAITTGEEIINCDDKNAVAVNDLDEFSIAHSISNLNKGKDLAGLELDGNPEFFFGIQLPFFKNLDSIEVLIESLEDKIKLGISFIILPPIFNWNIFESIFNKIKHFKIPIISSVFLIKSLGVARYIAINEPYYGITEDVIKRIKSASDRELECIKIASESIRELRKITSGVVIQTLGWEHKISNILDMAKL